MDISPPLPQEEPPSFHELPEPQQADYNEVLRVSNQALDVTPSVITNRYGNKKGSMDHTSDEKGTESFGDLYMDDDDLNHRSRTDKQDVESMYPRLYRTWL